ncbi:H(+)/Cl(-) exchange transporter 3, partial [Dictyocoela muelleri]
MYLENREGFRFTLKAGEAVRVNRSDESHSLAYVIQNGMTIAQINGLIHYHPHSIYPVVISEDFPCIVGQIQRRDLLAVLKSRQTFSIVTQTIKTLNRKVSVVSMSNLLNKS